jgi:hypothetical protein
VEASKNCTFWPTTGLGGEKEKSDVGGGGRETTTVRVVGFEPPEFVAVSVTV